MKNDWKIEKKQFFNLLVREGEVKVEVERHADGTAYICLSETDTDLGGIRSIGFNLDAAEIRRVAAFLGGDDDVDA